MIEKISNEEYKEKVNKGVIDCMLVDSYRFAINQFLNKKRRKSGRGDFKHPHERNIYDHKDDFRLPIQDGGKSKTIRCLFTSPYADIESIKNYIREMPTSPNYKIYLVNPRLYRYRASGTVSLAIVQDLDCKHYEGKTEHSVSCINDYMIEEIGEPLFYLI